MNSGVDEAKLTLQRVVGKFALLFAFIYLLALLGIFVTLYQGDEVPVSTWLLLLPAGAVFVPAVMDAVNLHRTRDPDRLSKLWKRCALLALGYANKWGSLKPHDLGILGQVTQRHENFMEDLNETLIKLAKVLDTSAVNMRSVATTYERTDAESAAQIDATYPAVQRPISSAGS